MHYKNNVKVVFVVFNMFNFVWNRLKYCNTKLKVKVQAVTQNQLLQLEMRGSVMASAIKITYLLQTINILYKNFFEYFKCQYTSVQYIGKCLTLSLNVNTLTGHLKKNFKFWTN